MKKLLFTVLIINMLVSAPMAMADNQHNHDDKESAVTNITTCERQHSNKQHECSHMHGHDLTNIVTDRHNHHDGDHYNCPGHHNDYSGHHGYSKQMWHSMMQKDFSKKDLTLANLEEHNLSGSNFQDAILSSVRFKKSDLSGADFTGALMINADLRKANLNSANLSNADLRGSQLKGASLYQTKYNKHTLFPRDFAPEAHGMIFVE